MAASASLKRIIREVKRAGFYVTSPQELRDMRKASEWMAKVRRRLQKLGRRKMGDYYEQVLPAGQFEIDEHSPTDVIDRRRADLEAMLKTLDSRSLHGQRIDEEYRYLTEIRLRRRA